MIILLSKQINTFIYILENVSSKYGFILCAN